MKSIANLLIILAFATTLCGLIRVSPSCVTQESRIVIIIAWSLLTGCGYLIFLIMRGSIKIEEDQDEGQ